MMITVVVIMIVIIMITVLRKRETRLVMIKSKIVMIRIVIT